MIRVPAVAVSEAHNQKVLSGRMAHDKLPMLVTRMIRIIEYLRKRIGEYGQSLLEADPMFPDVLVGLRRIPLELDAHRLTVRLARRGRRRACTSRARPLPTPERLQQPQGHSFHERLFADSVAGAEDQIDVPVPAIITVDWVVTVIAQNGSGRALLARPGRRATRAYSFRNRRGSCAQPPGSGKFSRGSVQPRGAPDRRS